MFMIAIIYGSVRTERQGIKAAKWLKKKIPDSILIDPMEYKLPLLDKRHFEQPTETTTKISNILTKAKGYIIVSAEYNHSLPPALKNLLDHFKDEYRNKPAGIVTYSSGSFGGIRAAAHLRDILATLGMITIPTAFPISKVQDSFDEEGNALDKAYDERITKFLDEFNSFVK